MKLNHRFFAALLIAVTACASAAQSAVNADTAASDVGVQQDARAQEIIRNADRVRAPDQPFRYTLRLEAFRQSQSASQQQLDVSMRFYKPGPGHEQGDARALVRFVSPASDKGKAMFSDFEKMWYYAPDLRRPIPISKQQRLIGQISNGDVVAADFDYSYISQLQGEEPCGDKKCYRLQLVRRWPYVTYPKITYWVEKDTYYPYRADFMSDSNLVMKRSYYKNYQMAAGRVRPLQIVVEDALQKGNYTTMNYSDVRLESLPESYFQKDYLMRLN